MPESQSGHHSLEQLEEIKRLAKSPGLSPREILHAGTQLVNHGMPQAEAYLQGIKASVSLRVVHDYVDRLLKRNNVIQASPYLRDNWKSEELVREFYSRDGYVFRRGSSLSSSVVIVFSTVFNNFTLSLMALDAILAQLGVSRLFLKTSPDSAYFRGVKGLANDLDDLPQALTQFLEGKDVSTILITGYSSGGYPSLYTALQMKHHGYIGYSLTTDLSQYCEPPPTSFYQELRSRMPERLFVDMRHKFLDRKGDGGEPYKIFFGYRSPRDRDQALRLRDLPNVQLYHHKEAGHEVPVHLLEDGLFTRPFLDLIERRKRQEVGSGN